MSEYKQSGNMKQETKVNLIYWGRKIWEPIKIILLIPLVPIWGPYLMFVAFMEEDDREFCQNFKYDYPWDKDHPHRIVKQWRKNEKLKAKLAKKAQRLHRKEREKESIRLDLRLKKLDEPKTREDAIEHLQIMTRKLEIDVEKLKEI